MKRLTGTMAIGMALGIAAVPVAAEDAGGPEGWHFQLAPYLWMASLEGDLATLPGLPEVHVDASFDDILDNLDFAVMLQAEARRGRFGLFTDLAYMEISVDEETRGPFFSGVDLETDTFFATTAAFYRVVDEERLAVDLFAGARVWYIDTELDLNPGILAGRTVDDDEAWADPVIGARGSLQVLGPLFLSAGFDLGGFGIVSDITGQALGTLDWHPADWLALRAGYRHLVVDYDHGGFVWDVALSGPIIGAALRF